MRATSAIDDSAGGGAWVASGSAGASLVAPGSSVDVMASLPSARLSVCYAR